jgi:hypothetical protein
MALACLLTGQAVGALTFGCLAALAAFVFYLWRGQIELATRLLGVSAHGLAANSAIIPATILLNLASLLAISPLCAFLGFAYMNGEVVPNPARGGAAECVNSQGDKVLCCSWQPNAFGQGYMSERLTVTVASCRAGWPSMLPRQAASSACQPATPPPPPPLVYLSSQALAQSLSSGPCCWPTRSACL